MRKGFLFVVVIVLMCFVITGAASADYGYTNVSQIPMAVDFSFDVEFDDNGLPHIVTDYPFEVTGADEMNLVYNKGESREAVTLQYLYPAGITRIGMFDGNFYDSTHPEEVYQAIRNGELTLDDLVSINTSRFSQETDWVLVYSVSSKSYVEYTERTHAQAFNAMGNGGVARTVYYNANGIDSTRVLKRIENADLVVERSKAGDITYAYITQYSPDYASFDYDPSTGLFGGHPVTELGFEKDDLEIAALASLDSRTGETATSVSMADSAPTAAEKASATTAIVGGLLAGILIGVTLYYLFRRKSSGPEKKVQPGSKAGADNTPAREETIENTAKHINQ